MEFIYERRVVWVASRCWIITWLVGMVPEGLKSCGLSLVSSGMLRTIRVLCWSAFQFIVLFHLAEKYGTTNMWHWIFCVFVIVSFWIEIVNCFARLYYIFHSNSIRNWSFRFGQTLTSLSDVFWFRKLSWSLSGIWELRHTNKHTKFEESSFYSLKYVK